ncbi:MAG TPA: hypothetical protein VFU49_06205 [Ktedonobacteraceae bacterium]|nr:hypothetical protein [Ktedonobacteraceae bacterium]
MDYILFVHGVNTRKRREVPEYAQRLSNLIDKNNRNSDQQIAIKMVPLYWGDVTRDLECNLLEGYRESECWTELSFKDIREKQLLQFTGDAALYISRYIGTRVVDTLLAQTKDPETGIGPGPYNHDRLHLVTHSWGTVILFDILFSGRWDTKEFSSYQGVKQIRSAIFGLEPSPHSGLHLCSIHTMGSPISIFSLMTSSGDPLHCAPLSNNHARTDVPNTHDITPGFLQWLKRLPYQIPWYNYLHPADLVAYPLQEIMPQLLENPDFVVKDKLKVEDIIIASPSRFLNTVAALGPLGNIVEKVHIATRAPRAHQRYWTSYKVAERILDTVREKQDLHPTGRLNDMLQGMKQLILR